jgi:hypothetical protein
MAPLRHRDAKLVFLENQQEREPSMSEITTIGLDLAKHVFQVHGINAQGTTHRHGHCHDGCETTKLSQGTAVARKAYVAGHVRLEVRRETGKE